MLLVWYSLLNNQNISINKSEKKLVTYLLGHLLQQKGAVGGAIIGTITGKEAIIDPLRVLSTMEVR